MTATQPAMRFSFASLRAQEVVPLALTAAAFATLFYYPFTTLVRDWWQAPEASYGFLLMPIALRLAWKAGRAPDTHGQPALGSIIIVGAVLLRYASGVTTEFFTLRVSMVGALMGLTVVHLGVRQVLHWWLPFLLALLSIPLPELVTQSLAQPLQTKAAQMGVALLELRHIPVRLSGNVIHLPGYELSVAEACSGLRSLTALLSTAILCGVLFVRTLVGRFFLLVIVVPMAIVVSALRVFLTAFLAIFLGRDVGTGFMHLTGGWLLFLGSLVVLAALTALAVVTERRIQRVASHA